MEVEKFLKNYKEHLQMEYYNKLHTRMFIKLQISVKNKIKNWVVLMTNFDVLTLLLGKF
jgi:hypothetical protein